MQGNAEIVFVIFNAGIIIFALIVLFWFLLKGIRRGFGKLF